MSIDDQYSPYFDDYDESKKFSRILFVPSNAVQVRELNQLQTLFQKQISRFGDHIFEDGSVVIPGELNFDLRTPYCKLTLASTYGDVANMILSAGTTVEGADNLVAEVLHFIDEDGPDPVTVYLKYDGSGDTGESPAFPVSSTITFKDALGDVITTAVVTESGYGTTASLEEGVFYIDKKFVLVSRHSIIADKYTSTPTIKVGIEFEEVLVTSFDDQSLLDNALGSPNYTAPGADRGKMDTALVSVAFGEEPENFVELIRINEGNVENLVNRAQYSILDETLARRTFDQSGDFTVTPFMISAEDHPSDPDKLRLVLDPGKAYVRGYEIETVASTNVDIDRARDTTLSNNSVSIASFGNYVDVTDVYGLPNVDTASTLEFYDDVVTVPGNVPSGSKVGEAFIRQVEQISANLFRLHIFGVTGAISSAVSVYVPGVYVPFTGTVELGVGGNVVQDSTSGAFIFKSPFENVKTLLDELNNTDTNYVAIRKFDVNSDSSGDVILNAGSNEVFTEYSISNYVLTTDAGEIVDLTGSVTRGGAPVGKQVTIALGVGYESIPVRVLAAVIKQESTHKTKAVQTTVINSGSLTLGELSLGKADILRINSIVDDSTSQDITADFTLDDGQRRAYYGIGKIKLKPGHPSPATTVTVSFDFFQHGSGDYFSVDSYASISYADIPTFVDGTTTYRLSDCFDFRARINDAGTGFTGAGSSIGNMIKQAAYITADVTSYLPRVDKVYLDYRGAFGIARGTSSLKPQAPNDPNDSMVLWHVGLDPYTATPNDVDFLYVENKRYTMRDIGKIEKRVGNLEYYTTLNFLEKRTLDQQVIDPDTGNNRFKNGFFAEPFSDHQIGDFTSAEVRCSVDADDGVLRTEFDARGVDLLFNEASSVTVEQHGDLLTLPYTDQLAISQPFATRTENVNPYAVFTWAGSVNLSPSSDFWTDVRYREPVVVFRGNPGATPQNTWLSWASRWTGTRTVASRSTRISRRRTDHTTTSVTNTVVDDKVVSNDTIPWIRPRTIKFTAKGLKPKTRVYPYFDGVLVSAHVKPDGGTLGQSLITDVSGAVSGEFNIPDGTFKTGARRLVLIDNASGDFIGSFTNAEGIYTAQGVLQTRQRTIVSTMSSTTRTTWRDPLAQSFLIENQGGAFLSKIRVWFSTKDDNVPISLDIREMENGQPTSRVVPYSQVVLEPVDVAVSANASVPTDFVFDTPVYLQEGVEYCFVVMADSIRYNMWISKMGERDVASGQWVSQQPYIGVMFKSQNSSTWTESQLEDIKFEIYRAKFTSMTGTVVLDNVDVDMLPIQFNPFTSESGSDIVTVNHPYHGLHSGEKVVYANAVDGAGFDAVDLNTEHTVVSVITSDVYTIQMASNATSSTVFGGSVMSNGNLQFNTVHPMVRELVLSGTGIDWSLTTKSGQSISGDEALYQTSTNSIVNDDELFFSFPQCVYNDANETALMSGQKSFRLTGTLTSDRDNLSPVIDVNRLGALVIRNRINWPAVLNETDASTDSVDIEDQASCRYINKTVTLDLPASTLRVWFDVVKLVGSEVDVYCRVLNTDSGENISNVDWVPMDVIKSVQPSGSLQFFEEEYEYTPLTPFNQFQVKIVPLSTYEGRVPEVRALRAVALS
jgi:hypothetical protein